MFDQAEMAERHGRILTELSELGAQLARKVHADAMAAETPDETASLTTAFHRISRSVRQTLALELRLKRDLERAAREARTEARDEAARAVERRKARVSAPIERLIWSEYEEDEADSLVHDLADRLSDEALLDGFTTDPVEAVIERICEDLGISPPAHPRAGGDPSRASTGKPADSSPSGGASDEPDEPDLTFDASG